MQHFRQNSRARRCLTFAVSVSLASAILWRCLKIRIVMSQLRCAIVLAFIGKQERLFALRRSSFGCAL